MALLGVSPLRVLVVGMLLSMGIECAQRFGFAAGRVASAADIVTNSVGALAGALIGRYRTLWLHPTPRVARTLAAIGALKVCALLAFTAWALSPDDSNNYLLPGTSGFELSQFPFTPGYGWYHGRVTDATIGEQSFTHAGDGPLVLRGVVDSVFRGTVRVSGRDERREFVPFVFVHDLRALNEKLLLGQQGTGARLLVNLRSRRYRFPGPSLLLRDAFPYSASGAQSMSFSVTPELWTLSSTSTKGVVSQSLPISLSLGWTLLQTAVRVGDFGTGAISVLWLFALWLPVGYWCAFAGRTGAVRATVAGGVTLLLALWLLPEVGTIARCSPLEWGSAIGGMACGVFFATRSRARRFSLSE